MSPAIFIPVAEEIGLIIEIGDWVVRRACALAALWPDHLTVAVNLSPAQFKAGGVHRTVHGGARRRRDLAPHRLELEITEGLILNDDAAIMRELTELKALGVSIVMDDFGTGYSSLSYLWKFPFDKIKIDRSFMRGLGGGGRSGRRRPAGDHVAEPRAAHARHRRGRRDELCRRSSSSRSAATRCRASISRKPMPIDQVALAILRRSVQVRLATMPPGTMPGRLARWCDGLPRSAGHLVLHEPVRRVADALDLDPGRLVGSRARAGEKTAVTSAGGATSDHDPSAFGATSLRSMM